jgi:hypothetical protein
MNLSPPLEHYSFRSTSESEAGVPSAVRRLSILTIIGEQPGPRFSRLLDTNAGGPLRFSGAGHLNSTIYVKHVLGDLSDLQPAETEGRTRSTGHCRAVKGPIRLRKGNGQAHTRH